MHTSGVDRWGEFSSCLPRVPIGRHRLNYHSFANRGETVLTPNGKDLRAGERWEMLHKTPYTLMIGRRLRRIREGRHLTQKAVADRTRKPRGNGFYSQGLLSRIEAGYANAPPGSAWTRRSHASPGARASASA